MEIIFVLAFAVVLAGVYLAVDVCGDACIWVVSKISRYYS